MLAVFATFCGLMLMGGWVVLIRDWIASVRWKSLPGTVRGTLVEPTQQTDPYRPWITQQGFRAVIRYAYTVDDQTYVGSRYSATREPFYASEQEANDFLQRFPLGSQLPVRVDPDDPTRCLLVRQLSAADALPGYMAFGCLMVGALFM